MKGPSDRVLAALGALALVPCLAVPISNPDLFWHLSAAKRMLDLGTFPRVDWLSSTLSGEPWIDFEWPQQLLYLMAFDSWGMAGLWALKVLLMLAALVPFWKTLDLYRIPAPYRAVATAFWGSAMLTRSDLRPEWFSVICFGVLFWRLEKARLQRRSPFWPLFFPFFAVWANFHAGFAYGLGLVALYTLAVGRRRMNPQWLFCLLTGGAGTLVQPYGPALYQVLSRHWAQLGGMQSFIQEWGGIDFGNRWHLPYWVLLGASLALALGLALRRKKLSMAPLAALIAVSYAASRHVRLAAYHATIAIPLSARWASRLLPQPPAALSRWACLGVIAGCGAFGLLHAREAGTFHRVFDDRYVPVLTARFLAREKDELSPLILYNDQFGWGGYLGYQLYPYYRIFQDGRYLFHPFLKEEAAAIGSPERLQRFFERYEVDGAIMENFPRMMETTRSLSDGSAVKIARPYYTMYFPKSRWALVYWDEKALVFIKREAVDDDWLAAREYRLALPFDDAARSDALARGEIRQDELDAEFRRHDAELAALRQAAD